MKKINLTISVFLLALVLTGCLTGNTTKEETITIGWIGALSGSATDWGVPALKAANLALEDVNRDGINGKKLKFLVEDGVGNSKNAANAAHKLINNDGVKIILSHSSAESVAIAPIAEENEVIVFASATSTPDLTDAGDYIFRVTPVNREGELLAEYLENTDKVAMLVEQGKYTQGIKNGFLNTYFGEVILEEFSSGTHDFRTSLTKIKAAEPDAILVLPVGLNAGINIIKQAHELGIDEPIVGNAAYDSPELIKKLGKSAEGIVFSTLFIDKNRPEVKDFARRYGEEIPVFAHTLDAASKVYLIAEALEFCGEENECIKDYLYSIDEKETLSGVLTIDVNGDAEKEFVLKQVVNGRIN